MGTVKIKNIFKYLFVFVLTMCVYSNVNAVQESVLTFSNDAITVTVPGGGYDINGTDLSITAGGVYRITGSSVTGTITVKKGVKGVTLIFDNLDLTGVTSAPLTINKDGAEVNLRLVGVNHLIDNEDPDNEFSTNKKIRDAYEGAAIKVKTGSKLTISGDGKLYAVGNSKNGIKGSEGSVIKVNSGSLDIDTVGNGLSSDNEVIINGGNVTIIAGKEGIKASPDEVSESAKGIITINGGTVDVTSGEDGIQSEGNITINNRPSITIHSGNDAIQTRSNFTMYNGVLNIYTFEGHNAQNFDKDVMSAKGIKASTSEYEVADATNEINIYAGEINIDSSDDAIHSDGNITITRGIININSWDDGIHADSKLTFGTNDGLERDPYINIENSNEGIEAANIFFYSGKIKVKSRDDGINAAGGASSGEGEGSGEHFNPDTGYADNFAIYGYGGSIYVNSGFDGLDANGSIYLYGGEYTIYSQGRGGTNSALDRDAHLVIDGATVFTSGAVGTNGLISNIESNQKFTDLRDNKNQGNIVAINDNGTIVFNDTLIKDTEYIFYTSPTLGEGATIEDANTMDNAISHAWAHDFDDGVITTVATPTTPGVITYTCTTNNEHIERMSYYYTNETIFNVYNKTKGNAKVVIGHIEEYYDFTIPGVTPMIVDSTAPIYLVSTTDGGNTFNKITPTSIEGTVYTFTLDSSTNQDLYIVYKGDTNHNGYISSYDELLIRKSMLDPNDEHYRALSTLETITSDADGDGDIDEDDITFIQQAQAYLELDYSFLNIPAGNNLNLTNSGPVSVNGTDTGTVDLYLKASDSIELDAMEAMIIPKQYFTVQSITPMVSGGSELSRNENGLLYLVNTNGYNIQENEQLFKITLAVNPNTPTGDYDISFAVGVYVEHQDVNQQYFGVSTTVHVDGILNPYVATFSTDEGVKSIDEYKPKNVPNSATPVNTNVLVAYSRNKNTGEYDISGEGQYNFKVKLKDGYVISTVTIDNAEHYNKLNGPSDTGSPNKYSVTKVTGDVVITITTKQAEEYDVTFVKGTGVKQVDYYYTHDYTTPDESNVTTVTARNDSTGEIDATGDGQANFLIVLKDGYKLDSVTVDGTYKNLKGPSDTKVDNLYRITKISGDVFVNITAKAREAISLDVEGLEPSYEYTEGQIKPNITVKIGGTDTVLTEGVDYTLEYGENKEIGQNNGSITIKSIKTSNYIFADETVNFDIVEYELKESNINVQSTIAFTGELLSPRVIVTANNKTLEQDVDYTVTYGNQDAMIGEKVTVTVQGIGNYTGSYTVPDGGVPVVDKPSQIISFDETYKTVKYGSNFIKTATLTEGDGEIIYTSSNPEVAFVNPITGAVIVYKKGSVIIKATASETDNYAAASAQYTLVVEPTNIYVQTATVSDKEYDGTTDATVTSINLIGQINDYVFVEGQDYTYTASFNNEIVGNNKPVTITVTLDDSVLDRFVLYTSTYETTASITPATITSSDVTLNPASFIYDGLEKTPTPTITINNNTLVKDTDYTVSYEDNINAGTGYVIINGINNYKTNGSLKVPFTINKADITPVIGSINSVIYSGAEQRPNITVTYNNNTLVKDTDYTVLYENNINASDEALVKIYPVETSNYTFSSAGISKAFTINPYTLTADNVSLDSKYVKYDGTAKEPNVTVTANKITLNKDIDYSVSYSNNTNVGNNAKITITPLSNNYIGDVEVLFEIINKEVLSISGIEDNQKITYTGSEVELSGNLVVSSNEYGITKDDLIVKYYNSSNNEEISKPTNVGSYYVVYSYSSDDAVLESRINFEIIKAVSSIPSEANKTHYSLENSKLSSVSLNRAGLSWVNANETILSGYNTYIATYTQNDDSDNYEEITVPITVYGKKKINITTSVNGNGGSISESINNVIEGETKAITITPDAGYEIKSVTVNGTEVGVSDNTLYVTAERTDLEVVATFDNITYELNIEGTNVEVDPNGIINVDYSSSKNIVVTAKKGYRLTSVLVNDDNKVGDMVNNQLILGNITENVNIYISAKKIEYEVIEGAKQTYTINENEEATFRIDADFNKFEVGGKVFIDGKEVESQNYISRSGSTLITFNKRFLDTLSIGTHTLDIKFNDGGVAQTTFTIAKKTTNEVVVTKYGKANPISNVINNNGSNKNSSNNGDVVNNPITHDDIMRYIALALLSIFIIILSVVRVKLKEKIASEE